LQTLSAIIFVEIGWLDWFVVKIIQEAAETLRVIIWCIFEIRQNFHNFPECNKGLNKQEKLYTEFHRL
jgi:hypothetical protein